MRILTVSDRVVEALEDRSDPASFPEVDLVLSCGDLPPEYLSSLARKFSAPLFYVRGNHDIRHDGYRPAGCIDADMKVVLYRGLRILGLEGSQWYNGKPHQYTERQMRQRIRKAGAGIRRHGGIDIVITHAPPRHVHDGEDQCHRGFESFHRLIERYGPRYLIHGHMHLDYSHQEQRMTVVNRTMVINTYGYYFLEIEDSQDTK
ncbi:MAG: metallophosphoesterase [Deltaproteobacteria bacterium]|nr:metallophosphoesterase [Deltaproteobacteria bacterium]MBW2122925.1 metallophosphoesterase [Deltaproteobacteria bacterium]